jgi:hypothetical protein
MGRRCRVHKWGLGFADMLETLDGVCRAGDGRISLDICMPSLGCAGGDPTALVAERDIKLHLRGFMHSALIIDWALSESLP